MGTNSPWDLDQKLLEFFGSQHEIEKEALREFYCHD